MVLTAKAHKCIVLKRIGEFGPCVLSLNRQHYWQENNRVSKTYIHELFMISRYESFLLYIHAIEIFLCKIYVFLQYYLKQVKKTKSKYLCNFRAIRALSLHKGTTFWPSIACINLEHSLLIFCSIGYIIL